jgi:hypothetical protein
VPPRCHNGGVPTDSVDRPADGPICPHCGQPLRGNLRHERLDAQGSSAGEGHRRVGVTYCGACGWPLHIDAQGPPVSPGAGGVAKVAAPPDETNLEGQFQLRCRDLISEIRSLGFDPFVWVGLINDLGAVNAAKTILADYEVLPVTSWLVDRGLPELTLEREIEQLRWADLFDETDRTEAVRRLASATRNSPNQ